MFGQSGKTCAMPPMENRPATPLCRGLAGRTLLLPYVLTLALAGLGLAAVGGTRAMGTDLEAVTKPGGRLTATSMPDAPLRVTFSGEGDGRSYFGGVWLHFGDGQNAMFCRPGSACRESAVDHTYARAGTYRAELIGVGEGSDVAIGSLTVIVTD